MGLHPCILLISINLKFCNPPNDNKAFQDQLEARSLVNANARIIIGKII